MLYQQLDQLVQYLLLSALPHACLLQIVQRHGIQGFLTYWAPLGILAVLSTFVGAVLKAPVAGILNTAKIFNLMVRRVFLTKEYNPD
jgi:membrane-associated phospholipid phosphatase